MKRDKKWAKNEVIKLWGRWMAGGDTIHELNNSVISIIDELDEPAKVVIPQFVADHIELCKSRNKRLNVALSESPESKMVSEMGVSCEEANEIYARAWLYGYEIEKEKLYRIEMPGTDDLLLTLEGSEYYFDEPLDYIGEKPNIRQEFTESEIKAIDERYWIFKKEVAQ